MKRSPSNDVSLRINPDKLIGRARWRVDAKRRTLDEVVIAMLGVKEALTAREIHERREKWRELNPNDAHRPRPLALVQTELDLWAGRAAGVFAKNPDKRWRVIVSELGEFSTDDQGELPQQALDTIASEAPEALLGNPAFVKE